MPGNRGQVGADLILGQADDRAAPGGGGGGPGFSVQAMAELSANVGAMAAAIRDQADRQQRLWSAIRPIPGIAVPAITSSSGTADYPELLAPRTGYWWDVKSVTCATFTAGSVNLYAGQQADSELRFVFPTAGTYTFGTGQLLVPPGQRLIFTAVSVTGNVTPSLTVFEIAAWALPAYLM